MHRTPYEHEPDEIIGHAGHPHSVTEHAAGHAGQDQRTPEQSPDIHLLQPNTHTPCPNKINGHARDRYLKSRCWSMLRSKIGSHQNGRSTCATSVRPQRKCSASEATTGAPAHTRSRVIRSCSSRPAKDSARSMARCQENH
jgi:hypothetical protein